MDIAKCISWCDENGFDAGTREGQRAYQDAMRGGNGKTGRKNRDKIVTLRCFDLEGGALFASAHGVVFRDRHARKAILLHEATEAGLEKPVVEVCYPVEE